MLLRYGPTDNHVELSEAEIDEEFGKQDIARVFIKRGDLTESDVERGVTEMFIVETTSTTDANADFGGVLRDISQNGSLTEFIVESFERYSRDADPTPGGERWDGVADSTIISDGVSSVPQLSAGTISTVRTPMTMVFSHSSQAKKIRETETAGGGELKYRPDKTVDYVASLGADKTATTLSPANQNIAGEFNAEKKGGDTDLTHLRLVGAGEGRAQQTVNFVPSADPYDYENDSDYANVNRYTASHWSQGDRKEWDVRSNKDHTDIDSLERLGETITDDIQNTHIEANANIRGLDVDLGDEFTVNYPEENISQAARVVKMTTMIDSSGFTYQVTLSSRQQALEDPQSEDRKDTDRYNLAFEGSPVTMTTGGGRQPVNASNNYEFDFYYPAEVKFEHRVNLFVKGLAYRAYSSGAAAGGEHTHSVSVTHPSHAHDIPAAEFAHTHQISLTNASAELHSHSDGTYGAANHPHSDGTYGAANHPHSDGTFGADSHPHSDGTFGADNHPHGDGTYAASQHGHQEGTFNADNHDHSQNITESSTANTPHGAVAASGDQISFVGSTSGWEEVQTISESGYEMGVVHVHATGAENVLECRARDSSDGSSGFDATPNASGTAVVGTSDPDGQSSSVTLMIPEDWGFIDVDVRASSGAVNTNVHVAWILLGEHTHDVTITSPTGFTEPAVFGQSADTGPGVGGQSDSTAPDVDGQSGSSSPDVDGSSGSTAPDVGGNSGSTAPDVGGSSGEDNPGVSGNTDSEGGIRTSTTELGTTESTTTPANEGGHTHDPEAGLIQFAEFPSNCDVLVNGQSVGTALGGGTGTFEQEVDIAGLLNPGQVNTIEITSDTLGHIQAHLDIDVYRQILGDG